MTQTKYKERSKRDWTKIFSFLTSLLLLSSMCVLVERPTIRTTLESHYNYPVFTHTTIKSLNTLSQTSNYIVAADTFFYISITTVPSHEIYFGLNNQSRCSRKFGFDPCPVKCPLRCCTRVYGVQQVVNQYYLFVKLPLETYLSTFSSCKTFFPSLIPLRNKNENKTKQSTVKCTGSRVFSNSIQLFMKKHLIYESKVLLQCKSLQRSVNYYSSGDTSLLSPTNKGPFGQPTPLLSLFLYSQTST